MCKEDSIMPVKMTHFNRKRPMSKPRCHHSLILISFQLTWLLSCDGKSVDPLERVCWRVQQINGTAKGLNYDILITWRSLRSNKKNNNVYSRIRKGSTRNFINIIYTSSILLFTLLRSSTLFRRLLSSVSEYGRNSSSFKWISLSNI